VAGRVAARFADGVWLAELAAVRDPGQVAATVAAVPGIRNLPSVAAADALAHALARRCARSARTWTGSGTRPAAAAAPT
jgi:predicted ATPase